jgi:hypothetical protein
MRPPATALPERAERPNHPHRRAPICHTQGMTNSPQDLTTGADLTARALPSSDRMAAIVEHLESIEARMMDPETKPTSRPALKATARKLVNELEGRISLTAIGLKARASFDKRQAPTN